MILEKDIRFLSKMFLPSGNYYPVEVLDLLKKLCMSDKGWKGN
eukprot:CAMPEP_0201285808 /NCGR_PEP_ID=MMETSP1317-20130820/113845_1 /ASSEMBLY_ACC=CAM_ASM_000770 /TAXON_ID=187299 /ORGANISM="Undescribed Undescribed, Strain Undescribed" /LENGTH=42 /DNA_ID= /DNA_START= /DNA_END= /DNA_ORIENTATION=